MYLPIANPVIDRPMHNETIPGIRAIRSDPIRNGKAVSWTVDFLPTTSARTPDTSAPKGVETTPNEARKENIILFILDIYILTGM